MSVKNFYTSGITANGYISFLRNNLEGIEKVVYITGEADYSPLSEYVTQRWSEQTDIVEYAHNPFMRFPYEAIINHSQSKAVVFNIYPQSPYALPEKCKIVDLDQFVDKKQNKKYRNKLLELYQNSNACLQSAYLFFSRALRIHDEWEKIYIGNMDFDKMNSLTDEMTQRLVNERSIDRTAKATHRFLGAATPEGAKDFVQDLTKDVAKRYFIKGRPGSGKSTMLKKIGDYATGSGFDIEVYHCGFDSNSLDMIIIPELSVCIFDSTAPHEHFSTKDSDEIVDVYKIAIAAGTDEKFRTELAEIFQRYSADIKVATAYLKTMQTINNEIDKIYNKYVNVDCEKVFEMFFR